MKKYTQIYNDIKDKIESGEMKSSQKLLSIRKAAAVYNVSITTVQNAYFDLCADGYIIAQEKSRYFVSDIGKREVSENYEVINDGVEFDLTGGIADKDCFDLALWQRYIRSALRQSERFLSYGEAKGEYDLRLAIAEYVKEKRNVITSPDRIVIAAGVSSLLHILCSLIDNKKSVSFPDRSFNQGIGIFSDYGFEVHTRFKDADIIYVSPSHMTRWGDVMPVKRRMELVEYSYNNGSIVIEDDYENEFLYNSRPTPSLYALGKGNIIYIGSFSAMLLPGIRISFMVLTDELREKFDFNSQRYAQTASKTEQIALCNYIRDGRIYSQTRKIRRLYTAKTKKFASVLKEKIPNASVEIGENSLQIIMTAEFDKGIEAFDNEALKVFIEKYDGKKIVLVISSSGIPYDEFDNVTDKLKKIFD